MSSILYRDQQIYQYLSEFIKYIVETFDICGWIDQLTTGQCIKQIDSVCSFEEININSFRIA